MSAERAMALVLKRSAFFASRDHASLQDLIDCADLALAMDKRDQARRLYEVIWIRRGFGAVALARQREEAARLGLWDDESLPAEVEAAPLPAFAVDRAIAELTAIFADAGALPDGSPDIAAAVAPADPPADLAAWLDQACRALRHALVRPDDGDLADLLDRLAREMLAAGPFDLALHAGASLDDVLVRLTFNALFHHLAPNHDLAYPPYGSARLFRRAARLDAGGLGPWFGTVGNVIRASRDVLGLIALATPDGAGPEDRWVVPLAAHLGRHQRLDLIDDLADRGRVAPLHGLLAAAARRAARDGNREEMWRIRDAGLDLGDARLAVAGQRMIALLAKDDQVEWSVLGEIHGTHGDIDAAEDAFATVLRLEPTSVGVLDRLKALRGGRFGRFAIVGGFGSDVGRRRRRAVHRPPSPPADGPALAAGSADD